MEKFQDLQPPKRVFLTDFELAAIDAIQEVFPNDTTKGCTFHFRQALMRRLADIGLRTEYSSTGIPCVKDWIRQIMGLTLLPIVFLPSVWSALKHPPHYPDADIMSKMTQFSSYFERTWMQGSYPPSLWSHFDNVGPRTTNLAEGWHSSLNHSFGVSHPSASNFLHWLQSAQHQVQCRHIQLAAGRPAKAQSAVYRDVDDRIREAKLQLGLRTGSIFMNYALNPATMWSVLMPELMTYLRRVSYLVAGNALKD